MSTITNPFDRRRPAGTSEPSSTHFAKKDASHSAFYAGLGKGMLAAVDGMKLFLFSKELHAVFWRLLTPIRNGQIAYLAAGLLLFILMRDPADDLTELFWTLSRWGRIVTVITSLILEKQFHADNEMFVAALKVRNPQFGAAVEAKQKTKTSLRAKFIKFKRVAKIGLFKAAGTVINTLIPSARIVAVPAVKFVSMRPVLGDGVSAAISAIHLLPVETLASSKLDDALVSFGEAIIDADDLGQDITKFYMHRMDSQEMRDYFASRYRGYLTGCGFVYSILSSIPFLGIPITLIAECGAACVVADIVQRNLEKEHRLPLACEDAMRHTKDS